MNAHFSLELKKMLRDKGLVFWTLLLPIFFIVIFASIFGNQSNTTSLSLHVVVTDSTMLTDPFIEQLQHIDTIDFEQIDSTHSTNELLESGDISTLLEINGEQLTLHYDGTQEDTAGALYGIIDNVSQQLHLQASQQNVSNAVGEDVFAEEWFTAPFQLEAVTIEDQSVDAITHIVPGYAVMFTFFICISMVSSLLKDLRQGMISRLATSPKHPLHYLLGKWFAFIVVVMLQIVILLGFGWLVYDVQIGHLMAIFTLSLFLSMTATAIGLLISMAVRSENSGIAITQVLALGGAIVSGLWMPIEFMPNFVQQASVFFPQYWAHQAYLEVMASSGTLVNILPSLVILLVFTIICLAIALFLYPRFLRDAA
ncbi:ABC transporter permease [Geomicrobium sediminis]|uniref:ABC-2 type transport system permease protein n=1 Tax=Geomicrobium sediminis TaxID=1347788 RepID=A0ABS2PH29_9BACL|nr:ABC transporter permease [Geomicrobium sediminis]MBM7634572.1 ABC-2 type transport system permease protein [Geomicrobium sediminis]